MPILEAKWYHVTYPTRDIVLRLDTFMRRAREDGAQDREIMRIEQRTISSRPCETIMHVVTHNPVSVTYAVSRGQHIGVDNRESGFWGNVGRY